MVLDQPLRCRSLALPLRSFLLPLLLAIGITDLLLIGIYALPQARVHDVGPATAYATGVHEPERAGRLTYAYTDGDASLALRETGSGQFLTALRLAGAGGSLPVETGIETPSGRVGLGPVARPRVYHLLLPANPQGDLQIRLRGSTRQIAPDPRQIGVMLDSVGIRSVGLIMPPRPALFAAAVALLLFWAAIAQLDVTRRWKISVLAAVAAVLCTSYLIFHGRLPLRAWWIGASLSAIASIMVVRFEPRRFLTSPSRVVFVVLAWRLGLWLVGAAGLWYSEMVFRYGRGIAFSFGKTIFERKDLLWRAVGSSWIQWDSERYLDIALNGYKFTGEVWPTIAFFPLYPLLIRAVLPVVAGNATAAALLIPHLALFVAVILLYDLLAEDFDAIVAYRAVIFLLLFPTSFYLVAGYTESLALALAVAALWAMRRRRWWLAGAAGALLSLTRVPGVLITPILAVAYLQQQGWRSLRPALLAVLVPPLGLGLFMLYQWWHFDTPFAFLIAQQSWNNGMSLPWVIPAKILRAIASSPEWEMAVFQLCVWIGFLILIGLSLIRLPLPYGLTVLLLLLPAYLANQRGSLVRHILIGFPAFATLAVVAKPLWARWLVISLMLPLLVVLTLLFVNGFGLA